MQGYLGGFANLVTTDAKILDFKYAPDARIYNLKTMEYVKNVTTPEQAIEACNAL